MIYTTEGKHVASQLCRRFLFFKRGFVFLPIEAKQRACSCTFPCLSVFCVKIICHYFVPLYVTGFETHSTTKESMPRENVRQS